MRIKHAHSSSLYSASASSLARQVHKAIDDDGPVATLLTFTEVGAQSREDVLRYASPDYGSWQPDITDVAVMWSKDQFDPGARESELLTDKVWTDGHGREHKTYAGSILLRHKGGQSVWVSVCHLPSHVQDGGRFYDNAQARAWQDAVDHWGEYWVRSKKKHKPDLGLIVADWNVDFHMTVWRQRVHEQFHGLANCWVGHMPKDGTHGDRLIDASLGSVKAKDARLLEDDKSSDHRPYGDVYVVPQ